MYNKEGFKSNLVKTFSNLKIRQATYGLVVIFMVKVAVVIYDVEKYKGVCS